MNMEKILETWAQLVAGAERAACGVGVGHPSAPVQRYSEY
jgi:hypothetical protein